MIAYLPPLITGSRRSADLVLRVDQATSRFDRGQFVRLAHRLYRGDNRWIPPLSSERLHVLRPDRNPLLDGRELAPFLGVGQNLGLGDEAVATLAAWPGAGGRKHEAGVWGSWGLFESINVPEMPERLLNKAENWLFENTPGIEGIRGPLGIEPLASPGLLTDGFDARPAAFLPYNPPYYPEMVESQGYEPGKTWRAYAIDLAPRSPSATHLRLEPPVADDWRILSRAYAAEHQEGRGAEALVPGFVQWLSDLAGEQNFPVHRAWRWAVGRAFDKALAVTTRDEEGAACFGIPDLAPAFRASRGHLGPIGWLSFEIALRRTRRLRAFPAAAPPGWDVKKVVELYRELARRARDFGYRKMVAAPISDDDERSIEALTLLGARPTQQFTVYVKQF